MAGAESNLGRGGGPWTRASHLHFRLHEGGRRQGSNRDLRLGNRALQLLLLLWLPLLQLLLLLLWLALLLLLWLPLRLMLVLLLLQLLWLGRRLAGFPMQQLLLLLLQLLASCCC